ncbi:hypothetical protein IKE67_02520 [bacterium]|nr:hypothetical protein [bacterium]
MISDISALTSGISLLDAINQTKSKDKEEKSESLEDIFAEIIDEMTENIEKQTEENNKIAEFTDNKFQLGPPVGLDIEGFNYYS